MIYEVSFSGFLRLFEIVVICMLLTLAEFLAVALLLAPRGRQSASLARACTYAVCTADPRCAIAAS